MTAAPARLGHDLALLGRMLNIEMSPSDVVIVHSTPSGVLGVARYLRPETPVGPCVGQLGRRALPRDIVALTEGRARAAVVVIHRVGAPAEQSAWLLQHARRIDEQAAGRATLTWLARSTVTSCGGTIPHLGRDRPAPRYGFGSSKYAL